jgi:hypothetical protein
MVWQSQSAEKGDKRGVWRIIILTIFFLTISKGIFIILSTALRVSRALRLNPENGAQVGMYLCGVVLTCRRSCQPKMNTHFISGKKSTSVAPGVPDSMVRLPACTAASIQ